jgi:hypothetical protein
MLVWTSYFSRAVWIVLACVSFLVIYIGFYSLEERQLRRSERMIVQEARIRAVGLALINYKETQPDGSLAPSWEQLKEWSEIADNGNQEPQLREYQDPDTGEASAWVFPPSIVSGILAYAPLSIKAGRGEVVRLVVYDPSFKNGRLATEYLLESDFQKSFGISAVLTD